MITRTGYKLFEMNKKGELLPLFIDKKTVVPVGKWVHAEFCPTKGFAPRGGWHIGADIPSAPWLMSHKGEYKSQRGKTFKRVWCEVEYNSTNDYNEYVNTLPKKCITDGIPEDGFYFFREVGKGIWVITSDIKVIRIIPEDERIQKLADFGFDEIDAWRNHYSYI